VNKALYDSALTLEGVTSTPLSGTADTTKALNHDYLQIKDVLIFLMNVKKKAVYGVQQDLLLSDVENESAHRRWAFFITAMNSAGLI